MSYDINYIEKLAGCYKICVHFKSNELKLYDKNLKVLRIFKNIKKVIYDDLLKKLDFDGQCFMIYKNSDNSNIIDSRIYGNYYVKNITHNGDFIWTN